MIDPESLDLATLPSLPLSERKQLPATPCVYFAMSNGSVQYIGRSINLKTRWSAHHHYHDLATDSCIAWILVSDPSLLPQIERALINWFNPPLNNFSAVYDSPEDQFLNKKVPSSTKTIAVLPSDLRRIKALRKPNENLYMTVNRILNIIEDSANAS